MNPPPCPLADAALRFPLLPALLSISVDDVNFPSPLNPDVNVENLPPSEPDTNWTFQDWDRAAERLRPRARGAGLLGILDPDTRYAAALLFAAWREGRGVVLLSRRLPPAEIARLQAELGITQLLSGADEVWPPPLVGDRLPARLPEGIAVVLLTSGSSGRPRAVAHSVAGLRASAEGSHANLPFGPGDVWLRSLSMHHVGGLALLFRALHGGGAVAFPRPGEDLAAACRRLHVTHLSVVPTQLGWLLADPQGPPPGLRAVLVGGGPIPADLIDAALSAGLPVHTTYGMTEMGSQVTTTPPGADRERLRTAGRPLPGREVRIAEDGEILVRGAPLFLGYLQPGGALVAGTDAEGWLHTGDIGALEGDGWLVVRGRRDQMFISGGENIHPEEIERALLGLAGVQAAAVVSVPDARWGARPVAFVRMAGGASPDGEGLREALRERLEGFRVPDAIWPWPEDAPGWEGKPPRAWLAERARQQRSGQ